MIGTRLEKLDKHTCLSVGRQMSYVTKLVHIWVHTWGSWTVHKSAFHIYIYIFFFSVWHLCSWRFCWNNVEATKPHKKCWYETDTNQSHKCKLKMTQWISVTAPNNRCNTEIGTSLVPRPPQTRLLQLITANQHAGQSWKQIRLNLSFLMLELRE